MPVVLSRSDNQTQATNAPHKGAVALNTEENPAVSALCRRCVEPMFQLAGHRCANDDIPWGEPLEEGLTDVGWADKNLRELAYMGIVSNAEDVVKYHVGLRTGALISEESFERMRRVRPGKFNGLGYQISKGARGTWEGNNGHAVGYLSCNYYHVEKGFYLAVLGNLGDTALPLTRLWDLRYGNSNTESGASQEGVQE